MNLLHSHGREVLSEYSANTLKQQYRVVKDNGKTVMLWTGSCFRGPKKSMLVKRANKAGIKRVVVLCPPTSKHLYIATFNVKGDQIKEMGRKVYKVV